MGNTLTEFLPWRRLIVVSVMLPLIAVLVILAFAWPAARIGPRDLPIGVVGASPTVAQLLTAAGQQIAGHPPAHTAAAAQPRPAIQVKSDDIAATSASDPRGLVLGAVPLPLTIFGVMMAAAIMLVARFRPAWRQLVALAVVSAVAGLGAYLIVQGFLGALPGEHAATWASLFLTLLAVGAPAAGLIALLGPAGLAVGAGLMIITDNAFSAATSAPQLLPAAAGRIGQWLPAGAGGNLLRSGQLAGARAGTGRPQPRGLERKPG
jgi:hypothetical protein